MPDAPRGLEKMSAPRRYEHAIRRVLDDGWTISESARVHRISRPHLSKKVNEERKRLGAITSRGKDAEEERKPKQESFILQTTQKRRIMPYKEWDYHYFGHLLCPDCGIVHPMPGFHEDITNTIRDPANKRVLINLPPYHAKTTLVSVRDTIYDICADPNSRTIIVSKSLPFARAIMHGIEQLLTNPELYAGGLGNLIEDFGPFKPYGDSIWSSEQIYVAGRMSAEKDPTVLAVGLGQQIYGRRANKIKFDDVATLENQRNPARVQETLTWTDQEALTRIGKNGIAIWSGTRVHPGDLYHYLGMRQGYKIIRRPVLLDEDEELTLWPEHFPFEQAMQHKVEMRPADFQLVYQQQDTLGAGASFTDEMVDNVKDKERVVTHRKSDWRMIGGLDLAGGTKGSGYTCFTALGVDLMTGKRFVVDQLSIKSMRAPQIKSTLYEWTENHGIQEWRVESNGLQSQIVQYNQEIIQELARMGVKVVPHITKGQGGSLGGTVNKWDPQFGVESMAPLFSGLLYSIPWGTQQSQLAMQPLCEELIAFPMGLRSDRVMSLWFADLGAREMLKRQHLPLFNERMKVPMRIRRGRRIVDFANQEVRGVPLIDQRSGGRGMANYRRQLVGRPQPHAEIAEFEEVEAEVDERPINVNVGGPRGTR